MFRVEDKYIYIYLLGVEDVPSTSPHIPFHTIVRGRKVPGHLDQHVLIVTQLLFNLATKHGRKTPKKRIG